MSLKLRKKFTELASLEFKDALRYGYASTFQGVFMRFTLTVLSILFLSIAGFASSESKAYNTAQSVDTSLDQKMDKIAGGYSGTFYSNSRKHPVQLIIYKTLTTIGVDSNGEAKFGPRLQAVLTFSESNFKLSFNVSLNTETENILFVTPTPVGIDNVTINISGVIKPGSLEGTYSTDSGVLGNLKLSKTSETSQAQSAR
jgi:hypothetical protein